MGSSANLVRRLLRWAKISRSWDDDASWPVQQVTYMGKTGNSVMWFPYGYHANVPEGQPALLMSLHGKAEARVAIPGSPSERPRIAPDEVAVFHPPTGSMVHLRSNGDIEVTSDNDQKVYLLRDKVLVETPHDVDVSAGGSVNVSAAANVEINATAISLVATGNITLQAGGLLTLSSTGVASLDGSIVNLGGAGAGVARLGDLVDPLVPHDIITASTKVFSG